MKWWALCLRGLILTTRLAQPANSYKNTHVHTLAPYLLLWLAPPVPASIFFLQEWVHVTAKGEWPGNHLMTMFPWAVFWTFLLSKRKCYPAQCWKPAQGEASITTFKDLLPPPLRSSRIRVFKSYKMTSLKDSIWLFMETVCQVLTISFIHWLILTFTYPANKIFIE